MQTKMNYFYSLTFKLKLSATSLIHFCSGLKFQREINISFTFTIVINIFLKRFFYTMLKKTKQFLHKQN